MHINSQVTVSSAMLQIRPQPAAQTRTAHLAWYTEETKPNATKAHMKNTITHTN